jgi:glycerophosphoryl diester phosphodiesterase
VTELIAHRAGNEMARVARAEQTADALELDVHLFRNRLEVRHEKVLWPFAVYWERSGIARGLRPPDLRTILDAVAPGTNLWIDLKGFTPRLARRVLSELDDRRPVTMSSRCWWVLRPAVGRRDVRTFRSIGAPWQLRIALRRSARPPDPVGHVMHHRFASEATVRALTSRNANLVVWGVTDLGTARRVIDLGVTGIIADDLGLLAQIRDEIEIGRGPAAASSP